MSLTRYPDGRVVGLADEVAEYHRRLHQDQYAYPRPVVDPLYPIVEPWQPGTQPPPWHLDEMFPSHDNTFARCGCHPKNGGYGICGCVRGNRNTVT